MRRHRLRDGLVLGNNIHIDVVLITHEALKCLITLIRPTINLLAGKIAQTRIFYFETKVYDGDCLNWVVFWSLLEFVGLRSSLCKRPCSLLLLHASLVAQSVVTWDCFSLFTSLLCHHHGHHCHRRQNTTFRVSSLLSLFLRKVWCRCQGCEVWSDNGINIPPPSPWNWNRP